MAARPDSSQTHSESRKAHIPDNAVIYDPLRDECRTKDGQNTWRE